jgi:hypothetical protein
MTSQGTPHGRFSRAIQRGHLFAAEMAAREMGSLPLSDALSLCILYRREQDPKFDRAAVRWVRRMQLEHSLRRQEVDLLRAGMAALGSRFDAAALNALLEACRELAAGAADVAALGLEAEYGKELFRVLREEGRACP